MTPTERLMYDALQAIAEDGDACGCFNQSWTGEGHAPSCPIAIAEYVLGEVNAQRLAVKH